MTKYIVLFYILLIFLGVGCIILKIFMDIPNYDTTGKKYKIPLTKVYIRVKYLYLIILPFIYLVIFTTDLVNAINLVTILKFAAGILFFLYGLLVVKVNKGVNKEMEK